MERDIHCFRCGTVLAQRIYGTVNYLFLVPLRSTGPRQLRALCPCGATRAIKLLCQVPLLELPILAPPVGDLATT